MIFGVGVNDVSCDVKSYSVWHSMLRRCYSAVYQRNKPTYKGCAVEDTWKLHSNFRNWFDLNYVEGWHLDKDLLKGNSLIYSQETCCFLPASLNSLITVKTRSKDLPQGVYFKVSNGKYVAQLSFYDEGVRTSGHLCISNDIEYCFSVYKKAKERKIKEIAAKYSNLLKSEAMQALLKYSVEP